MSNKKKPIEIFRPGRHTTMAGETIEFSADDVAATVAAYDPAVFQAPLCVGHPKANEPAYGWVKSLAFAAQEQRLQAEPDQVEPQFAELVSAGRFKKVSAAFFHPAAPNNPVPGVYYLKHVGFLGAAAPAVAGLKPVTEFAAAEDGTLTVEFSMPGAWSLARLARSVRDFLLEKYGAETADRVVPAYVAEEAEAAAREPLPEAAPAFAAPQQEKPVSKTKEEELAARETALREREARIAADEKRQRAVEFAEFAEQQIAAGRILPAEKNGVVAFMESLAAGSEIAFAAPEGGEKKTPAVDWFRNFVGALPKRVDFAEHSAPAADAPIDAQFAAPAGFTVSPDRMELHRKAQDYMRKHNCDYTTAISAVGA